MLFIRTCSNFFPPSFSNPEHCSLPLPLPIPVIVKKQKIYIQESVPYAAPAYGGGCGGDGYGCGGGGAVGGGGYGGGGGGY